MDILYIIIDTLKFGLPYAMLALGVFITYRQLDIADLGCEGTFTLGGAVSAVLIFQGLNPFLATFIAVICGFIAGLFTGILHTQLKIPALLSGIITLTALFSVNMVIMGFGTANNTSGYSSMVVINKNIDNLRAQTMYDSFSSLIGLKDASIVIGGINFANNFAIIILSIILILVVLVLMYLFFGTEVGMSVRATGMNIKMARAQGINTSLMIILGLGISNALIAFGGSMYTQINRSASNTMGVGVIVIALSSVIIGESIFGKKTFKNWIISVSLGAIIYYLIITIALALKMPNHFLKLLYASLIIIVLSIPLIKEQVMKLHKKKEVA